MVRTVTSPYDLAEHLRTPEEIAVYLDASIVEANGDVAFIAKGMPQVACDDGLSRESLYKAHSGDRNPSLNTVLRVIGSLGLKLHAEAVPASDAAERGTSTLR